MENIRVIIPRFTSKYEAMADATVRSLQMMRTNIPLKIRMV